MLRLLLRFAGAALWLCFCSKRADASGWNDYELSIDPGYRIVRCNTLDVCLTRAGGSIIYFPQEFVGTGPIVGYCVTPTHIFLRTAGRTPRNSFPGDTFENVDSTVEYFFVLEKATDGLEGPMTAAEFAAEAIVTQAGVVQWTAPVNPHPEQALFGAAMFVGTSLRIFFWPVLFCLLIAAAIVVLRRRRRSMVGARHDA